MLFDEALDFKNGFARIMTNGKWGAINKNGEIKVNPIYDDILDFSEGMALVWNGSLFGYVDSEGKELVPIQ